MILDMIQEWFKELLIDGIISNLTGMFDTLNTKVGEIAGEVGMTPAAWNSSIFNMIRNLSETVIVPIAGIILTFVMCYELIQMLIDRNNLHDIDTWLFFKWVIKTFIAVTILSNTFNIVMAVFDVAQSVVAQSAGLVQGTTDISPNLVANMQATIEQMELGPLLGLWMQSFVVHHTMTALNIFIFVVVYGRMIEIYMLTSLAPLPFATVVNRDLGHMGHNYFRSLMAIGFQGLLIIVCLAIYAVLIQSIAAAGGTDIFETIWTAIGCTVLLCFTLLKTGSLAKAVFGAH